jgi:hypothetical protein
VASASIDLHHVDDTETLDGDTEGERNPCHESVGAALIEELSVRQDQGGRRHDLNCNHQTTAASFFVSQL